MQEENKRKWIRIIKDTMEKRGIKTSRDLAAKSGYTSASIWAAFSEGKKVSKALHDAVCESLGLNAPAMWKLLNEGAEPTVDDISAERLHQLIKRLRRKEDVAYIIYVAERLILADRLNSALRQATSDVEPT